MTQQHGGLGPLGSARHAQLVDLEVRPALWHLATLSI